MTIASTRRDRHRQWLLELTAIPTAAGREYRVVRWVRNWLKSRRNIAMKQDRAGNLIITQRRRSATRSKVRPLLITAHLDHPAFVVVGLANDGAIELEFRGGVHDPYFENARIDVFDERDQPHAATIVAFDNQAKPFKRAIAQLDEATDDIAIGDVARWRFESEIRPQGSVLPSVVDGILHTHACDDLAAVAAALSALDVAASTRGGAHVGVLLTRAEEVGFIGAIAACKHKSIPNNARLICLENSRSFADSPIGAGPIMRVGDKMSVFEPTLTNRISMLVMEHQKTDPTFKWQRKLMPGGTCEATTFSAFGYESTCLCLALGNYHNMVEIDAVLGGRRPARVGPEFIAVDDYHGLIDMLVLCATSLDPLKLPTLKQRMETLFKEYGHVLADAASS